MTRVMPTRDDLIGRLQRLRSGQEDRTEVSAWAMSIINDDSLCVTDRLVWNVLERLGAADLPAPDRDFLYSVADFEAWQSELAH